ncbi:lipopolysaccharide heptosyltransferase II [Roseimaritima sediminicola]|uniref:lipopolysaccharide heptosyltransferase II n=1 Tax=Roseimaritima sediminicola TaxID=2662066 RepID=UPI0012982C85|nr:lipopolysaccharide heptosyltransferase II [Roseimaritima sediminicola]
MKIAVILPSWVGDTVMATPALRSVRQRYPDAHLVGLGRYAPVHLLEPLGWFDDLVNHGKTTRQRLTCAWRLRSQRFDLSINFPASESAALIARTLGAPHRLGFDSGLNRWLLNDLEPHPRNIPFTERRSEIERFLGLVQRLGCDTSDRRVELRSTAAADALAQQSLAQCGLDRFAKLVVVNSSGAVAESKLWHEPHLIECCRQLAQRGDTGVLIHCGPGEREAARAVTQACDHPAVQSMADWPELPLELSISLMRRAAVVVSTDSGPRHIAVAMNRPVISLFGSTNVEPTRTFNHPEVVMQEPLACRPCWKKECPLGHHDCMRRLTPERVRQAVEQVFAAQDAAAA